MIKIRSDRNLRNENNQIEDEIDNSIDDKVCVYETIISGGCIKQEPCDKEDESESIQTYVDIKEEIIEDPTVSVEETGLTTNIEEDCLIYCEGCDEEYDLYCLKCPMLNHILDSNRPHWQDNRVKWTLPRNFVDIRKTPSGVGIIALRFIPEGVVLGPFEGLESTEDDAVSKWKLKNKELLYTKYPRQLNWMQYIRRADQSSQQNLTPFQHEGKLYYRSDCNISVGDELLVCWYGDDEESGIQDGGDGYCKPRVCEKLDDTYACTLCCVGYKSICHLAAHNSRCPEKRNERDPCTEIIQCAFCKIYLNQKEYLDYHMNRCCEKNIKKYVAAPSSSEVTDKPELKDECSMCEYSTSNKGKFDRHQQSHTKVQRYKCPECPYRARTEQYLQKHVRTHANSSRSRFECRQCNARFIRADLYALHQKKHPASVSKCDKCVFETINPRDFIDHLERHKDAESHRCDKCDKQFIGKYTLLRHVKNMHNEKNEKYKCPKCPFESIYRANMKEHLSTVHSGVKRFQCPKCAFKTSYKKIIRRHLRRHEDAKPIKRENSTNSTDFGSQPLPGRHEKKVRVSAVQTYSCYECNYRTKRKSNFDQHVKVHDADRVKPFACTFCPFKTTTRPKLNRHITVTHNDDKSFKCDVCPKLFKQKQTLIEHARNIHSEGGKREYKCPHCHFVTKYKRSIEHHVNAHNKSELFQCSKCDFNSHHKDSFRSHQKRHESTKKHGCHVCSYRTNDECELNEHLKTHELLKPVEYDGVSKKIEDIDEIHAESKAFSGREGSKYFDCPTCGMTFNLKINLAKHIKRLHACKVKKEESLIESDN